MPATDLSVRHLEWFLGYIRDDHYDVRGQRRPPISARTYNAYRGRLRPFCKWLYSHALISHDPSISIPRMRVPPIHRLRLSAEQVRTLMDNAKMPRDRALIAVAFFTAIRTSELKSLRIQDLDFAAGTIRIQVWKSGIEDGLPMTPELRTELAIWLQAYGRSLRRSHGRPPAPTDMLIPQLRPNRYGVGFQIVDGVAKRNFKPRALVPGVPIRWPHEVVNALLREIGITKRGQGMHTLRRSAARIMFDTLVADRHYDAALRIVQATLHHASSETTEQYIGLKSEVLARDKFLRGARLLTAEVPAVQSG